MHNTDFFFLNSSKAVVVELLVERIFDEHIIHCSDSMFGFYQVNSRFFDLNEKLRVRMCVQHVEGG